MENQKESLIEVSPASDLRVQSKSFGFFKQASYNLTEERMAYLRKFFGSSVDSAHSQGVLRASPGDLRKKETMG